MPRVVAISAAVITVWNDDRWPSFHITVAIAVAIIVAVTALDRHNCASAKDREDDGSEGENGGSYMKGLSHIALQKNDIRSPLNAGRDTKTTGKM